MSAHHHTHAPEAQGKTVSKLVIAFAINMLLTVFEVGFGIFACSIALIGDALHNMGDAFSILIAIIAYKIGTRKADAHFSYGLKRAETVGGFVNLILLFISGAYLLIEGFTRLFFPEQIDGWIIIWVSVLALIIDSVTAKISHTHADHSMNMKMLFVHNLSDALGSVGVIVSGVFVVWLDWNFVDGLIAVMIALYMLIEACLSFPKIVALLMNAVPENLDIEKIKKCLLKVKGVDGVHHIHVWNVAEGEPSLECHIISSELATGEAVRQTLAKKFHIHHSTIQVEAVCCDCPECVL